MPRRNLYLLLAITVVCLACAMKVSRYGRVLTFAMDEIEYRALEETDQRELFEGALTGMMDRLDEYSVFIPPETVSKFTEALDQQFGGVGIEILLDSETGQLTVASPLHGTPAYEAGIRAGDKILRIDGRSTQGLSAEDASERIRGKPGDPVTLTVLHPEETEPEELQIVRAVIQVDTVLGDTRNADGSWNYFVAGYDRLGYLRINSFGEHTVNELKQALEWLVEHDMQSLILDLRNDPGGLLAAAIGTCDLFVESGTIVSIRRRDPNRINQVFSATNEGTYTGFPMAVLVNRFSASASEIVAACLQDYGRAIVVGERSYGKGTVQELVDLQPGQGMLKLTTSSYWRPSDQNIHRRKDATKDGDWGVSPDDGYEVKLDEEEMAELAVWRRNRDLYQANGKSSLSDGANLSESYFDPQLAIAIQYVQSQLEGR